MTDLSKNPPLYQQDSCHAGSAKEGDLCRDKCEHRYALMRGSDNKQCLDCGRITNPCFHGYPDGMNCDKCYIEKSAKEGGFWRGKCEHTWFTLKEAPNVRACSSCHRVELIENKLKAIYDKYGKPNDCGCCGNSYEGKVKITLARIIFAMDNSSDPESFSYAGSPISNIEKLVRGYRDIVGWDLEKDSLEEQSLDMISWLYDLLITKK